ncbi:MAG: inner membrane-spanning protein YciB [Pseudomonadota bacterium]
MAETETQKAASSWLSVAVDYGPLLAFLVSYRIFAPDSDAIEDELVLAALTTKAIVQSTGVFIVAAVIALGVSKWRLGRVSPMLWFSTALIVVFGGFTIWTGDQRIIQLKPTVLYVLFGCALLIGWRMGRALLKILLEAAFEGLSDEGWLKLSRNWGVFFLFLAVLNEGLVAYLSFEGWLWAKFWVFMPLSFLFTFANVPMLLKHGLDVGQDKEETQEG